MGPYHFARMHALRRRPAIRLTVAETSSRDDHNWSRGDEAEGLTILPAYTTSNGYMDLQDLRPEVVVVPGYWDIRSLVGIAEYRRQRREALLLLWSESTALDHRRNALIETFKTCLMSNFDGALVAGSRHAAYLAELGMPAERIGIVGNCVDNEFFSSRARALRTEASVAPYFLFVGRLIPEKNIEGLIRAYERYRQRVGEKAWPLQIVGSGPLESRLKAQVDRRALRGVTFAGLRQVHELTQYYAHAGCFVLPSTSEPWGLVVNEAMACGLTVLVSDRCGCAPELVREGVNGFTFDPQSTDDLASLMERVSSGALPLARFGRESVGIVSRFTPEAFAERTEVHLLKLLKLERLVHDSLRRKFVGLATSGICQLKKHRSRIGRRMRFFAGENS